jgi:hypothetical protein
MQRQTSAGSSCKIIAYRLASRATLLAASIAGSRRSLAYIASRLACAIDIVNAERGGFYSR